MGNCGKYLRFTFVFILCIFFSSCNYDPIGSYESNLLPKGPPNVRMNLSTQTDTIKLHLRDTVEFFFETDSNKIMERRLTIDGKDMNGSLSGILSKDKKRVTYKIDVYSLFGYFPEMYHKMNLRLVFNSNSGSLADVNGMEGYILQKEWVIKLLLSTGAVTINSANVVNGTMLVDWGITAEREIIDSIRIRKSISGTGVFTVAKYYTIPDSLIFRDDTYLGEGVSYQIELYVNSSTSPITSNRFDVAAKPLSVTVDNQITKVKLSWSPSKLYSNIDGYKVTYTNSDNNPVSTTVNDTTFTSDDYIFADRVVYTISPHPKKMFQEYSNFETKGAYAVKCSTIFGMPTNLPNCKFYQTTSDTIIYTNYSMAYIYSTLSGKSVKTFPVFNNGYDMILSPNGQLAFYFDNSERKLYTMLGTSGYKSSYDFNNKLIGQLFNYIYNFQVSNDGILIGTAKYGNFYCYDLKNDSIIVKQDDSGLYIESAIFSDDCRYAVLYTKYSPPEYTAFKISAKGKEQIATGTGVPQFFISPTRFIAIENGITKVIELPSNTVVKQITQIDKIYPPDKAKSNLLTYNYTSRMLTVWDTKDFSKILELKATQTDYTIHNDIIYSPTWCRMYKIK